MYLGFTVRLHANCSLGFTCNFKLFFLMLKIPFVLNSKENCPSPLAPGNSCLSPRGQTPERSRSVHFDALWLICPSCDRSIVWHWPLFPVASVLGHRGGVSSEVRGESCCSHWLGCRCQRASWHYRKQERWQQQTGVCPQWYFKPCLFSLYCF